jgi:serine/threonine-protein kinase
LLVGEPVFVSQSVVEVCAHHLHSQPVPPSERTSAPITSGLDALILRCLAKDPEARPASARELVDLLDALEDLGEWTSADADRWWQQEAPSVARAAKASRSAGSTPGPRTVAVDLGRREPSSRVRVLVV